MLQNTSLKEFGYNFLGPILTSYINGVQKKLELLSETQKVKVFHLAREGFLFQKAFSLVNNKDTPSTYLNVSRTFLFKITCDIEASWQYSVKHSFEGTLNEFFHARYSFVQDDIEKMLPESIREKEITLPKDYNLVCDILEKNKTNIAQIVSPIRDTYLEYLNQTGFFDNEINPVLLDVGYSGTIQKLLALIVNRHLNGIYMITTKSGNFNIGQTTVSIEHVFKTGVKMGSGYMMLDRSMFLESLLTAPNGQFVDIIKDINEGDFHFCYGKRTYTQEFFSDLDAVQNGALNCLQESLINEVTFSTQEIEEIFTKYVTHRNLLPRASWPLFTLDDAISGQGNLNPLSFFGL